MQPARASETTAAHIDRMRNHVEEGDGACFEAALVIYVLGFYRLKTPVPPWAGHGPAAQTGALGMRGHSCAQ